MAMTETVTAWMEGGKIVVKYHNRCTSTGMESTGVDEFLRTEARRQLAEEHPEAFR